MPGSIDVKGLYQLVLEPVRFRARQGAGALQFVAFFALTDIAARITCGRVARYYMGRYGISETLNMLSPDRGAVTFVPGVLATILFSAILWILGTLASSNKRLLNKRLLVMGATLYFADFILALYWQLWGASIVHAWCLIWLVTPFFAYRELECLEKQAASAGIESRVIGTTAAHSSTPSGMDSNDAIIVGEEHADSWSGAVLTSRAGEVQGHGK